MPVRINYFQKLCDLCQAFGTARNRHELLEMIFASAMEVLGAKAGSTLKKLVYELFEDEVTKRSLGEVID